MKFDDVIRNIITKGLLPCDVEQYVKEGGDLNHRNFQGWTLLHYAAEGNKPEVIRFLIEKGANLDLQDEQGWTPLHHAVDCAIDTAIQSGGTVTFHTVKALIDGGAREGIRTHEGETPRDIAACYGQYTLDLYEAVTGISTEGEPSIKSFASDCCKIIRDAGFDVRLLEGFQISVAEDGSGHEKPWYHFYISGTERYSRRHDPGFPEDLISGIREKFESLKKRRQG